MKRIQLVTIGLLLGIALLAQPPNSFNYQAVLRNADGSIVANQPATVFIEILSGTTDGPAVFTETHNITTSPLGMVNLTIGSINNLSVVDWSANHFFIKITFNGVVLGVVQLLSVPYALHAHTTDQPGPQGETGPPGAEGSDGLSAYEVWLELGNEGTVEEFIASLTGPEGPTGTAGLPGVDGQDGANILDELTDVDLTDVAAGKILKYDAGEEMWVISDDLGITSETDPIFVASSAAGIDAVDIANWTEAHGWGDHSDAGYLESDPTINVDIFNASHKIQVIYPSLRFIGRLFDENNAPFEGNIQIDAGIYNHPSSGSMLWAESHLANFFNGYFELLLGSENPIPLSIISNHYPLYLGFSISAAAFSERIQLYKTNRAFYADLSQDAEYLQGLPASHFLFAEDFELTPAATIENTDIDKWNNAYGVGSFIDVAGVSVGGMQVINSAAEWVGMQIDEYDPTVPSYVKDIGLPDIENWDQAHSWGDHTELYRPVSWVPSWTDVTGKPTTFTPSAHSHDAADITSGTLNLSRLPVVNVPRGGTGIMSYVAGNFLRASGVTTLAQRTPAEVRLDIGAAATSHTHSAAEITTGTLAVARGGTGLASYTAGNFILASAATTLEQRTPAQVLTLIGAAPTSHNHSAADITAGTLPVARGGTGTTTFTSGNVLIGSGTGAISTLSRNGIDTRTTFPPAAHTHDASSISSGIFTLARLPIVTVPYGGTGATTFTSGNVLIGSGTGAITTLSRNGIDTRTDFPPAAHTHGNITSDGKIGTAAGRIITTGTDGIVQATAGTADGQMLYWNGTAWIIIPPGDEGQVLTFVGGVPTWRTPAE